MDKMSYYLITASINVIIKFVAFIFWIHLEYSFSPKFQIGEKSVSNCMILPLYACSSSISSSASCCGG